MKSVLEKAFPTPLLYLRAWSALFRKPTSYLRTTGWLDSLGARRPLDPNGDPIPWMNYAVVRLLKERLTTDLTLFEYGSGYSTEFFAARVAVVTSVEYDAEWVERIRSRMPGNATIVFREADGDGEYCRAIHTVGQPLDVVVIDGRDRVNCLRQALGALTPRGVILFDDTHRERYRDAFAIAREAGFRALSLDGLKPTGNEADETTIFYRDGNCLGL